MEKTSSFLDLVKLEEKTAKMVLLLLKEDIKVYGIAKKKEWVMGMTMYEKRIRGVFKELDEIEVTLNAMVMEKQEAVDEFKLPLQTNTRVAEDTFGVMYNAYNKNILGALKAMKQAEFELSMYKAGFQDYQDDEYVKRFAGNPRRRLNDGKIETRQLE